MQITKQWYLINWIDSLIVANGHMSKANVSFLSFSFSASSENIFHSSHLSYAHMNSTLGWWTPSPLQRIKMGCFLHGSTYTCHQRCKQMWGSGLCCIPGQWSHFSSLRKIDQVSPDELTGSSGRTRTPTLIKSTWIYLNVSEGHTFLNRCFCSSPCLTNKAAGRLWAENGTILSIFSWSCLLLWSSQSLAKKV